MSGHANRQEPSVTPRGVGVRGLSAARVHERRERVFLVLAGVFLGTLAMLNILGITRFIDLSFTVLGF